MAEVRKKSRELGGWLHHCTPLGSPQKRAVPHATEGSKKHPTIFSNLTWGYSFLTLPGSQFDLSERTRLSSQVTERCLSTDESLGTLPSKLLWSIARISKERVDGALQKPTEHSRGKTLPSPYDTEWRPRSLQLHRGRLLFSPNMGLQLLESTYHVERWLIPGSFILSHSPFQKCIDLHFEVIQALWLIGHHKASLFFWLETF